MTSPVIRRRSLFALLWMFLLFAGVSCAVAARPDEPTAPAAISPDQKKRLLAEAIKEFETAPPDRPRPSVVIIRVIGEPALPELEKVINTGSRRARLAAVQALRVLDKKDQGAAIPLLRSALLTELDDSRNEFPTAAQIHAAALDTLERFGPLAKELAFLVNYRMTHDASPVPAKALRVLREQDISLDKDAARVFLQMLKNEEYEAVAVSLEKPAPREFLKGHEALLMNALRSQDAGFRKRVEVLLSGQGVPDKSGEPPVDQALKEVSDYARYRLVEILRAAGRARTIQALIETLNNQDDELHAAASQVLERLAAADPTVVATLAKALREKNSDTRRSVITLLKDLGTGAAPALAALSQSLHDPDPVVRARASQALVRIGPAAVPSLIAALSDQDPDVRRAGAFALGRCGPAAKEGKAALRRAVRDSDAEVRLAAAQALSNIEGKHP